MLIRKGTIDKLDDCRRCLDNSLLKDKYFYDGHHTFSFLTEGFNKGEIYIASDSTGETIGFMRIDLTGTFAKFPLLRVVAVKDDCRRQGIGTVMLEFYEELGFENSDKTFLLVSEFNSDARHLYERIGYRETGKIPNLYQAGISEFLMMKLKGHERGDLPNENL